MKTVVAIHTAMPMVEPTKELFSQYLPHVRLINIVDDSLIQDIIKSGQITQEVKKRLIGYYYSATDAGADVIFNTCSSVGEVAQTARNLIDIPIVKIDDDMALDAVKKFTKIGVLATLKSTLIPTGKLLRQFAALENKNISIFEQLAEGAFEAVLTGNRTLHDELIHKSALKYKDDVDAFVLAQGSMARMEKQLTQLTGKPILSSPEYGVKNVKRVLDSIR